eukprot:CAMPEP_0184497496 /NCGR_PEP_ID=MMETSP0113_2-20130426/36736_1 /TAXON_ID=91329 /ORGANISM="Norrisiella sphaerica, Strain BC52" /LENGTH=394 /DNA_ID=CAMNT_0026884629 /DNA_START=110 /DNA_END=1294 /DNA_ORIENTATION=+
MSLEDALGNIEDAVCEHLAMMELITSEKTPAASTPDSRLSRMIPNIHKFGKFFTPLPLRQAYHEMNGIIPISQRAHVPVSFHEIRHIFNLAQVVAIADSVRLLTFDGDKTLYEDRSSLDSESPLVEPLLALLQKGCAVALVTAVGYPEPSPYESRLSGLLERLKYEDVSVYSNLFVVGGQCNYLFRCEKGGKFAEVPDEDWRDPLVASWDKKDVKAFLDLAADTLENLCNDFKLKFSLVRKPLASGVLYDGEENPSVPLFLDEIAFEVRDALQDHFSPAGLRLSSGQTGSLPFCTFNGGRDVFVDVGSKAIGIRSLQRYLGLVNRHFVDDENAVFEDEMAHTLHVGDQFTRAGNDLLARKVASTLWVSEPSETLFFIKRLKKEIHQKAALSITN